MRPGLESLAATLLASLLGVVPLLAATVADRLAQYGAEARHRLQPIFARARVPYPPAQLTLVGLKQEERLDVYAGGRAGSLTFLHSYPILAESGGPGPKLRVGDGQVPEGLYRIELLNPNSLYHLSLRVSYPNAFDRRMARADGRNELGGDIMIHGDQVSIGCLAMGNPAAEELFVLAADTGLAHVDVILAPNDLRSHPPPAVAGLPPWTPALYRQIRDALDELPARR
jgi:murein L,D-transpeptidase YafK